MYHLADRSVGFQVGDRVEKGLERGGIKAAIREARGGKGRGGKASSRNDQCHSGRKSDGRKRSCLKLTGVGRNERAG